MVKSLPANAGDMGLIPGSGRFPGEGNGYALQYPYLGDLMDRGAWRAIVHGVAISRSEEQEYWSRLPFPSPGHLPNPGIRSASPALPGGFLTAEPPGNINFT